MSVSEHVSDKLPYLHSNYKVKNLINLLRKHILVVYNFRFSTFLSSLSTHILKPPIKKIPKIDAKIVTPQKTNTYIDTTPHHTTTHHTLSQLFGNQSNVDLSSISTRPGYRRATCWYLRSDGSFVKGGTFTRSGTSTPPSPTANARCEFLAIDAIRFLKQLWNYLSTRPLNETVLVYPI